MPTTFTRSVVHIWELMNKGVSDGFDISEILMNSRSFAEVVLKKSAELLKQEIHLLGFVIFIQWLKYKFFRILKLEV